MRPLVTWLLHQVCETVPCLDYVDLCQMIGESPSSLYHMGKISLRPASRLWLSKKPGAGIATVNIYREHVVHPLRTSIHLLYSARLLFQLRKVRTTSWRTLLPRRWNPDSKAGWEPVKRVGCMCCHPWVRQGHYKQVLTSIQWASLVSWQWCNNLFIICGLIYQTETTVGNIVLCKSLRHFEGVLYLPYAASSSGPINFEPVSFSTSEVRDKPSCASEAFPDTIDIVNSQREVCGYIINVL
jgi:hypothetical protein